MVLAGQYLLVCADLEPGRMLFNSSTGTLAPVNDQTVFQITGYHNSNFWGKTVTQLGSSSASSSALVGSITPEGQVLLTFTHTSSSSSPSLTEGFGKMPTSADGGVWRIRCSLFPTETLQIGHWAYMMLKRVPGCRAGILPSAGVSVPAFLSQYEEPRTQPIGSG